MDIYYFGHDSKLKTELDSLVGKEYTLKSIDGYSALTEDSLVFIDMREMKDGDDWTKGWPTTLPFPRKLLINNIRVIGITGENTDTIALEMLENDFFDFIRYPFDLARVRGSILNSRRTLNNELELKSLYKIGIELSTESNLDALLKSILNAAMDLTSSDGGSIYLVKDEVDPQTGEQLMQFEHSLSDTLGELYSKFKMPVNDKSLSGYVVNTGKSLSLDDVYEISADVPYKFNSTFDKHNNYRTKSVLVVPMINHNRQIIGALQLINRKKDRSVKLVTDSQVNEVVIDYDHKCELLIRSLGSQATVSIETSRLYRQLHELFESFMNASVNAVESRDPTTAGHSRRVSKLSVAIASHINMSDKPAFKNVHFSVKDLLAIKYAGLLHDFGKIGVNEKILLKAKKLFDEDLKIINARLEMLRYSWFIDKKDSLKKISETIDTYKDAVLAANEPGRVEENVVNVLQQENKSFLKLLDNKKQKVITDEEFDRLVNSRGSLSAEEYKIIQSHVEHSYKFLTLIEWPSGLEKVPKIALSHHEKLDGSGYPYGIKGDEIPIESQIMCIADIFDALIASDRPYKTKMTLEKAFDILDEEASMGKINKDILDIFFEEKVYEVIEDVI